MRDEELALRFFSFWVHGVRSYRTPQKHWLNMAAKEGRKYPTRKIVELNAVWENAIASALEWFEPHECFRRLPLRRAQSVNRALFDVVMHSAARVELSHAKQVRRAFRKAYQGLLQDEEFSDLIGRAVDHTKRTKRRFEMWDAAIGPLLI